MNFARENAKKYRRRTAECRETVAEITLRKTVIMAGGKNDR